MYRETQRLHAGQTSSSTSFQKTLGIHTTFEIQLHTTGYTKISCTSGLKAIVTAFITSTTISWQKTKSQKHGVWLNTWGWTGRMLVWLHRIIRDLWGRLLNSKSERRCIRAVHKLGESMSHYWVVLLMGFKLSQNHHPDSHLWRQGKTQDYPPSPLPPEGLLRQSHRQPLHPVDWSRGIFPSKNRLGWRCHYRVKARVSLKARAWSFGLTLPLKGQVPV